MPNRNLTIKGREVGLDVNKIAIYKTSISQSNLIAVVAKSIFMNGYSFLDDETQEDYVCQCDDPCRTVLNLSIRAANQPPTVTITGSTSSLINTNVTLTANANDPEGFALSYLWSTGETTQSIVVTSSSAQTSTYTVTVTDDIGDTGSDTHDVVWSLPATTTTTTTAAPGTTTTTTTTTAAPGTTTTTTAAPGTTTTTTAAPTTTTTTSTTTTTTTSTTTTTTTAAPCNCREFDISNNGNPLDDDSYTYNVCGGGTTSGSVPHGDSITVCAVSFTHQGVALTVTNTQVECC